MIAGNGNTVEFRHVGRSICKNVRDDPHRWFGRIDIGIADHELLEDVVLDGPVQLLDRHSLLLARDDEEGQNRNNRAVHGHGHRHLVERDAVEQDLHVLDTVDRHTSLADIADNARMIAVIAPVGGKVEGDGEPLLTRGEIAAIKGVGFLSRGEASILADGPGASRIHGCPHAAREGRETRQAGIDHNVFRRVERLDGNALWRVPGEVPALHFLGGRRFPVFEFCHVPTFSSSPLAGEDTNACQLAG